MNIGYGQMDVRIDVRENLNIHCDFSGYVGFIKHRTLHAIGISLKMEMEKVNMMVQEHA